MRRTAAARAVRKVSALLILGYSLAACGGGSSEPPPAVASVEVTPAETSRQVGENVQLSATVKDVDGNILSGHSVSWSSSASTVASVSASGLVTAHALGQALITAASGSRSGVATINVVPEPIASITVAPTNDTVLVDETVQLTPTMRDANNNVVNRQVNWTSNASTIATVSTSGLVTGVSDGTATITATVDGRSASATIRVHDRCSTELSATIAVGQTINGSLATTDCQLDDETYADGYAIQVTAATNVQIDMTAGFDTWLALLELLPTGVLVERAVNDDVDPDDPADPNDTVDTNSRIIFTLQPGAQYFILANSFDANVTGNYQLKVTEVAPFVTGAAVSGKPGKAPLSELLRAFRVKPVRE